MIRRASDLSLFPPLDVDWPYWGPVTHVPCGLGQANGHLSYGALDPNPSAVAPVARGPVSHQVDTQSPPFFGCGNDHVKSNPAGIEMPPIPFPPPPPTVGIDVEQTYGCSPCHVDDAAQVPA